MLAIIFDFIEIHEHTHSIYYVINFDSSSVCAGSCRYLQDLFQSPPYLMGHVHVEEPFLLMLIVLMVSY